MLGSVGRLLVVERSLFLHSVAVLDAASKDQIGGARHGFRSVHVFSGIRFGLAVGVNRFQDYPNEQV